MITIGINCAGRWTNVGIAKDGRAVAEHNEELGRRQSELLPIITERLLSQAGYTFKDAGLIAIGVGPGYYTGIRAGIAYGAALAEALGIEAVPLCSLEIFARSAMPEGGCAAPVFKARSGSCYAAVYDLSSERAVAVLEPCFIKEAELLDELVKYPEVAVVSPDIDQYRKLPACGLKIIRMESASGGVCAELGCRYASKKTAPKLIRGAYLREPDIGPANS